MTDTNDAAQGGSEVTDVALPTHVADGNGALSPKDAARSLLDWRRKQAANNSPTEFNEAARAAMAGEPAEESTEEVGADPHTEAPGETEATEPEETLPPIEPPKSWTKEEKERFSSLPRETQEYLAQRETERDAATRRSQNEAAEHRKAIEAERNSVGHLKAQYETALATLHEQLQAVTAGEFSDVKTMEDVNRLATEDPVRFAKFQAHQMRLGAMQRERQAAQQRAYDEAVNQFSAFKTTEAVKLIEKAPELSDAETMKRVTDSAVHTLRGLEFSDQELSQLHSGEVGLSVHDHRFQLLLMKAIKYDESQQKQQVAQKTVKEKLKTVPPVQKPGAPQGKGAQAQAEIANLQKQLDNASGRTALKLAAQLQMARRRLAG